MTAAIVGTPVRGLETPHAPRPPGQAALPSNMGVALSKPVTEPDSEASSNSAQRLAFYTALIFFFLRISFLHEFIAGNIGIDLHLIIVFGGLCYVAFILSGGVGNAFKDKCTWIWLGFLGCFTLATATSTWIGGSLPTLENYYKTSLPLLLIIPAVTHTRHDVRKFMVMLGLAGMVSTLAAFVSSDFKAGRMQLEGAGSIANPNDYAAHLIFLLPAIVYLAFGLKRSFVFKIVGIGMIGAAIKQILSTGSRGGMVGLIVFTVYVLIMGNRQMKTAILLGGPTLVLLALPLVPKTSTQRLASLFNSEETTEEAAQSSESRRALLRAGIQATLAHPMLGVGPDVFTSYQGGVAAENGERGIWHGEHNSYLQISAECGIPALVLYLSALGVTFAYLRKASKSYDDVCRGAATTLSMMLIGYGVCIVFLTQGYNINFLTISGLAISMNRILTRSLP